MTYYYLHVLYNTLYYHIVLYITISSHPTLPSYRIGLPYPLWSNQKPLSVLRVHSCDYVAPWCSLS